MHKKKLLLDKAEELFVWKGLTLAAINAELRNVSVRTLQKWKNEYQWEAKRNEIGINGAKEIEQTARLNDRIYSLTARLIDETTAAMDKGQTVETTRLTAIARLVSALQPSKKYEATNKPDDSNRKVSPEDMKRIEEEIFGM